VSARHLRARALKPITPSGLGWLSLGEVTGLNGSTAFAWVHFGTHTQVLSALDIAAQPRSGTPGPQWHISVVDRSTEEPFRASSEQIRLARCAFGMLEAEEDNHHPGNARHFWLPIDPSERVECECKTDELLVEEPDGYQWTNPVEGECRGCEHERVMQGVGMRRPCPLHSNQSERMRVSKKGLVIPKGLVR
jgi:hypothetical protein